MTIPIFIPYVNRPDMLNRVVSMIPKNDKVEPVVINNSGEDVDTTATVLIPPVPLTFTQSQNWMLSLAKEFKWPFYMWAHCDALLGMDSVERLYERAMEECAKGTKWGVIYTHYDILSACNVEAMDAVGGYDTLFFDYASDCDVYRRLDLAGYARMESGIPVGHDQGSSTLRADPEQSRRVGLQVTYRSAVYRAMWGGDPGRETFADKWGPQ